MKRTLRKATRPVAAPAEPEVTATLDVHLSLSIDIPEVHGHPNRIPFEGCLTIVDSPSDKSPSGARGHRVILTRAAAEEALPSLMGMAIDYKASWDGHDVRQKCGIITHAGLQGNRVMVRGYVFARDFPEFETKSRAHAANTLGMSYELADAHVKDMRDNIWTLTRCTFTGAAVLLRDKAAYRNTMFRFLSRPAASPSEKGDGESISLISGVRS